ncbi:MAG: sigma 54-interacting transcriptional regulator [Polyangiaceae bacterium]
MVVRLHEADDGDKTGTMAGEPSRPSSAHLRPGLVLAYAPELDGVPPVVLFESAPVIVGREPPPGGAKLPLTSVSRLHARLERHGDRCTVHDLGSRNGVLVRGRKIDSAELRPGDDVRIGDAVFIFREDGADAFVGSRADGTLDRPFPYASIACGPLTRRLFEELVPIAGSEIPVLVLGETGTGKELVAEAIHAASGRSGAMRALNCAAIPASLVESELFGFKKGAFTGADRDHAGIVRAAHGGTLFLDEIGDMPADIQPKLLRLLESREVSPVGAEKTERVDVRIVCATHADLDDAVKHKRFRADLFSRIRGHVVSLPPLRDRKEDLYRLVRAVLARLGRPEATFTTAFMMALVRYDWPFNVRELVAVLRRALVLAQPTEALDVKHLPDDVTEARASKRPPAFMASEEAKPPIPTADEMREALKQHGGNVAALARIYQRDRSLIHRWLKQHGISPEDYRQ